MPAATAAIAISAICAAPTDGKCAADENPTQVRDKPDEPTEAIPADTQLGWIPPPCVHPRRVFRLGDAYRLFYVPEETPIGTQVLIGIGGVALYLFAVKALVRLCGGPRF